MKVRVRGTALYFDVEGTGLERCGAGYRPRPALLLLHGGPGADHTLFRPHFSQLTDAAQVVYLDLRGHGRSDASTREYWNLAAWADDVYAFCEALNISRPVVFGGSFGGFVALAYALRHPGHPAKLILSNTRARTVIERIGAAFERLGGIEARLVAERFWTAPTPDDLVEYARAAAPHYLSSEPASLISDPALMMSWIASEHRGMNLLGGLAAIQCPTLVLAGKDDPVCPIEDAEEMAAALPPHLVEFHRFDARHELSREAGPAYFEILRAFIRGTSSPKSACEASPPGRG